MKRLLYLIIYTGALTLLCTGKSMASSLDTDSIATWAKQFEGWTEERFQQYEDSVYSSIYAPVIARKADSASFGKTAIEPEPEEPQIISVSNEPVPVAAMANNSNEVGEIPIKSGTSQSGAKTYEVPIQVPPGMNGLTPSISLTYNSQSGTFIMGEGWSLSGVPMISRSGKTRYYDNMSEGITMNNTDAFYLDGVRLLKISTKPDYILYESEYGQIKVKAYYTGNVIKYFEVFYPDGRKGVFGDSGNTSSNYLYYPLMVMSDLFDNTITYEYIYTGNHYKISQISYNGASVQFQYLTRPYSVELYSGGLKITESQHLQKIICKQGSQILGTYSLGYKTQNYTSLVSYIRYNAGGKFFDPLRFTCGGTSSSGNYYTTSQTQLNEWYESTDPSMVKTVKGKFDYDSGSDGLIVLPNLNPYWQNYGMVFGNHNGIWYENKFTGQEEIFLYAGLEDSWAMPMPNLTTGTGFLDIFCADLEGTQEEFIIKANNVIDNGNDKLTFTVYRSRLIGGLETLYTRTYTLGKAHVDSKGGQSLTPKFFYPGDYNGDGKMEVMVMTPYDSFQDGKEISKCYVFDLANNMTLYQSGGFLRYHVTFVGLAQPDPKAAANNSDKLLQLDYDGDGKTDLCHISDSGMDIYTFMRSSGSNLIPARMTHNSSVTRQSLVNKDIMVGEFNGDGLTDFLVSPARGSSTTWYIYYSMGNGNLEQISFHGPAKSMENNTGFILQDVNSDGKTDLLKYDTAGFDTYLYKNNYLSVRDLNTTFQEAQAVLVPASSVSRNSFTQLMSLKGDKVTKYKFPRNANLDNLITSMSNSLGAVEQIEYHFIDGSTGFYQKGSNATFPYVNIQEPLAVVTSMALYVDGEQQDKTDYTYYNAVAHRQGLGFCGFERITHYDQRTRPTEYTYEPYRRGMLKSVKSDKLSNTYDYSLITQDNGTLQFRLDSKQEEDLLTGNSIVTTYTYDDYGYPTQEYKEYSDGLELTTDYTYQHADREGDGYNLGYLTDQVVTATQDGEEYKERAFVPVFQDRKPIVRCYYVNGHQVSQRTCLYDGHGNVTTERKKSYDSPEQVTTYTYDSQGKVLRMVSPMGFTSEFTYDAAGRVSAIKDYRGGVTTYTYDNFGREVLVNYPDSTSMATQYTWSTEGTNGKYAITKTSSTGVSTATVYDALGRAVRRSENRFDGNNSHVDLLYDRYGNLQKESLPFTGSSATQWKLYGYDNYNRLSGYVEASGKEVNYFYSGNSVTYTDNGITTTRTFDARGNLISVTDPTGTISYHLAPDGKPSSIEAPGGITTTFTYDDTRRRVGMTDPSFGTTTYEYDASGNLAKETDANGKMKQYAYDDFGRLTQTTTPELVTTYTYNNKDELTNVSSSNGTSKTFTYDAFGRLAASQESVMDGKWLRKDYTYSGGNVASVKYTSQNGVLATEQYVYANGHMKGVNLDDGTSIYNLDRVNNYGQPMTDRIGGTICDYGYDTYGRPRSMRTIAGHSVICESNYSFEPKTGNLTSRKDARRNITESFSYDGYDRLTSFGGKIATYDSKGNITSLSDVGVFTYGLTQKPYALSGASLTGNIATTRQQDITYASFSRPLTISENGYTATFDYNGDYDRVKMTLKQGNNSVLTRYYLGGCYELDVTGSSTKEKLYLTGDYYSAPAVVVKEGSSTNIYYILRDYLGSITHIFTRSGDVVQELSYDAWGRLRDPATQQVYASGKEPTLFLGRGYTGHEHLTQFGLINMNARLYDPALGRFLSPDPYVQMPDMSQSLNRYTYAMNNPLCYVDQDGEFAWWIVGAIAGAYLGGVFSNEGELNPLQWNFNAPATYLGIGFGGVMGGAIATGIANPGTFAFVAGVDTKYLSAGVVIGAGLGTNWKFDFQWSTAAGGGGSTADLGADTDAKVEEAILRAQWDYSAYQYATMVAPMVLADDVTGVGIANDWLVPLVYLGATGVFLYDNQENITNSIAYMTEEIAAIKARVDAQIENLAKKDRPEMGYTYKLIVKKDSMYRNVRTGQDIPMKRGQVWKIGESLHPADRYSDHSYESRFFMDKIYYGTKTQILIKEKTELLEYFLQHGHLPPGNKIFK